jgi:hypothetical protein
MLKGVIEMCLSCGCGEPNERHGDDRNITQEDIDQAAEAAKISPAEVIRNIASSAQMPAAGLAD